MKATAHTSTPTSRRADRFGRAVLLGLGLLYLVLAVGGFVAAGWDDFGPEDPNRLFGFLGVGTLLNVGHTMIALAAVVAALRRAAYAIAPVLGVAFLALAAFGTVAQLFRDGGDLLGTTWGNVVLYLLSLVACVSVYVVRARSVHRAAPE